MPSHDGLIIASTRTTLLMQRVLYKGTWKNRLNLASTKKKHKIIHTITQSNQQKIKLLADFLADWLQAPSSNMMAQTCVLFSNSLAWLCVQRLSCTAGMQNPVLFQIKNASIYNILRWVAWTIGQTNRRPSVWCSKYYFF